MDEFDALQYIASYEDLIQLLGPNEAAGEQHWLTFGQAEGRQPDNFDEVRYLENYPDLQAAFGDDTEAATLHYIQYGYFEGRTDEEPPPPEFDPLQYIASYDDLIAAIGANPDAGTRHYLEYGRDEGRAIDTFDEEQYLDNYPDLAAVFGNDGGAATLHYILFGNAEGRVDEPLPLAVDDAREITEDSGPVRLTVLANDSDAEPNPDGPLSIVAFDTANTIGAVDLSQNGRVFFYDPGDAFDSLAEGQTATDTFAYTIENEAGGRSTATVTMTITGVNDAPLAADDASQVLEDAGPVVLDVLANDTDPDQGDTLAIVGVDGTNTTGTVTLDENGQVVYDPTGAFDLAAGETATDSFTYTIEDASGTQSTATVTVTVTGVDEAPTFDFMF